MRVALGQINMIWENRRESIKKAEMMMADASRQHADLLIFPETSFTGISLNLSQIGESPQCSTTVECMKKLSRKYHLAVGFGWAALPEDGETKGSNHFSLMDAEGTMLGDFEKLHPFSMGGESAVYRGGNHLVSIPFQNRKISLFVCYDLRFPEIFQIAARKSDLFLVIANWPASRQHAWEVLLQARAVECEADVVGVNCTGEQDGIIYGGGSMLINARGDIIGRMDEAEGVLVCELPNEASALRERFCVFQDRREALYQQLSE